MRRYHVLALRYMGLGLIAIWAVGSYVAQVRMGSDEPGTREPHSPQQTATPVVLGIPAAVGGAEWFRTVKTHCNPVEVDTHLRVQPAPESADGNAWQAACYALAGRIEQARALIFELPADDRWKAAGVVFNVGHPVADAGDDRAAGPIMELVVEFWPNHYMALYHAGAARFATEDYGSAKDYLERFLQHYDPDDGWRRSALGMLDAIEG